MGARLMRGYRFVIAWLSCGPAGMRHDQEGVPPPLPFQHQERLGAGPENELERALRRALARRPQDRLAARFRLPGATASLQPPGPVLPEEMERREAHQARVRGVGGKSQHEPFTG